MRQGFQHRRIPLQHSRKHKCRKQQGGRSLCFGCRLSSGIYDPGFRQNGRAPQGRYLHRQPEFAKGTVPLATM